MFKFKEDEMSDTGSLMDPTVSSRCSEGRWEGLGDSLLIERACDEIMMQFIEGVDYNSSVLSTSAND